MKTNIFRMVGFLLFTIIILNIGFSTNETPIISNLLKYYGIANENETLIFILRQIFIFMYTLVIIFFILKTAFVDVKLYIKQKTLFIDKNGHIFFSALMLSIFGCLFDSILTCLSVIAFFYVFLMKTYINHVGLIGDYDYREDMRNCCDLKNKILYEQIDELKAYSYVEKEKIIIHENCIIFKDRKISINDALRIKTLFSKNIYELNDDEMVIVDMLIV